MRLPAALDNERTAKNASCSIASDADLVAVACRVAGFSSAVLPSTAQIGEVFGQDLPAFCCTRSENAMRAGDSVQVDDADQITLQTESNLGHRRE
jgi:hypothetical protein